VAGARLTCTFTNTSIQPDFGTCDARMFMDESNSVSDWSRLNELVFNNGVVTFDLLGTSEVSRNALGFNPLDNYIYGISWGGMLGRSLYRVGSDGSTVMLGEVVGLPSDNYNNGVISPTGDYYVYSADNAEMYRIAIGSPSVATLIPLSRPVGTTDLAWYNGLLYGIDEGSLVSIHPSTGVVTTIGSTQSSLNFAAAMWGGANGLFAGLPRVYAIDPLTGAATLLSSAVQVSGGDGANCPTATISFDADLSVTKTNTPASGPNDLPDDTYTPGEVRTYSIVVSNSATSFGAQNITVSDPIPAGIVAATVSWTCTSTSGDARCGAASGTGALNDTGLDLPPGAVATYQSP
jgi:uncharacterized repeat protein (TIGR01451 family)